jgi:ubiquitin carboxyl-terminal hydrolase 7
VWGESHVDLHGRQGDRPIVLFLKCFDVDRQTLFGVSQFYAAQHDKVSDLFPQILKLLKWPANTNFKLYEVCQPQIHEIWSLTNHSHQEIKHNMIEPMKPKQTLQQSEIQDGDIITIQRVVSEKE